MQPGDVVRLRVPAATAFVGVARSLAAGVATRLDFDLDHVEDLRLAVSEACSIALPAAALDSDLALDLHIGKGELTLELTSATTASEPPGVDSFAWTVLTALAEDASAEVADGRLGIRLRFVSAAAPLELDGPAAAELS